MNNSTRLIAVFLTVAVIFAALVSCGRPDNVSESGYNAAVRIIQIADDYLDYKISSEEAGKMLDEIEKRNPFHSDEYDGDLTISIYFTSLSWGVHGFSGYGESEVLEARNIIAKEINKTER